jgi:hypothetical protein
MPHLSKGLYTRIMKDPVLAVTFHSRRLMIALGLFNAPPHLCTSEQDVVEERNKKCTHSVNRAFDGSPKMDTRKQQR